MRRDQLVELQYIAPSSNVRSIFGMGILSHRRAKRLSARSIADPAVQERRARKVVPPSGRRLHEYVNLYFNARNPMLYTRKELHEELCVLRVATDVLDVPGAVIADCNASSDYVAFWPSPTGLDRIALEHTFAEWWHHPDLDQVQQWRLRSATQADCWSLIACLPNSSSGAMLRATAPSWHAATSAAMHHWLSIDSCSSGDHDEREGTHW